MVKRGTSENHRIQARCAIPLNVRTDRCARSSVFTRGCVFGDFSRTCGARWVLVVGCDESGGSRCTASRFRFTTGSFLGKPPARDSRKSKLNGSASGPSLLGVFAPLRETSGAFEALTILCPPEIAGCVWCSLRASGDAAEGGEVVLHH